MRVEKSSQPVAAIFQRSCCKSRLLPQGCSNPHPEILSIFIFHFSEQVFTILSKLQAFPVAFSQYFGNMQPVAYYNIDDRLHIIEAKHRFKGSKK